MQVVYYPSSANLLSNILMPFEDLRESKRFFTNEIHTLAMEDEDSVNQNEKYFYYTHEKCLH